MGSSIAGLYIILIIISVIWGVAIFFLPLFVWSINNKNRDILTELTLVRKALEKGPQVKPPGPVPAAQLCPSCGGEMVRLKNHDRDYFCPACQKTLAEFNDE